MTVEVFYLPENIIQVHCPADARELLGRFVAHIRQTRIGPASIWEHEGLAAMERLSRAVGPAHLTPSETQHAFHLAAVVCISQSMFRHRLDFLRKAVLILAEIAPCCLSQMCLPPPETVWANLIPSTISQETYRRIRSEVHLGSLWLPMLHAYILFRDLSLRPDHRPEVVLLTRKLQQLTPFLHLAVMHVNQTQKSPPSSTDFRGSQ